MSEISSVKEGTIEIRRAVAGDLPHLVEFNQAMAWETEHKKLDTALLERGVGSVFEDEKKGFYVVAENAGRIVGGLMITYEWSDWRSAWFWWIQSVYIRPEARGQRIYSRLYDFVKKLADADGKVCGFRLYVENDNKRAQGVYSSVGMSPSHYLMYEETK